MYRISLYVDRLCLDLIFFCISRIFAERGLESEKMSEFGSFRAKLVEFQETHCHNSLFISKSYESLLYTGPGYRRFIKCVEGLYKIVLAVLGFHRRSTYKEAI